MAFSIVVRSAAHAAEFPLPISWTATLARWAGLHAVIDPIVNMARHNSEQRVVLMPDVSA